MNFEVTKGMCNYCGRTEVYICSTPEKENLCADCHKLVSDNSLNAIKAIKAASPTSKNGRTGRARCSSKYAESSSNALEQAKAEAEAAIFKITGGMNIKLK